MIHALKIKSEYFEKVISGEKLFEVRVNDRDYKVGDLLGLNEIDKDENYTGRSCMVYVDYIYDFGQDNIVVMTIKPVFMRRSDCPKDPFSSVCNYSVQMVSDERYSEEASLIESEFSAE